MPYTGKYAYQFWIRSTLPQTISFKCDSTYKKFDVSTEWVYFSIIFDVSTISNIRLEFPKGQYWIYNMKLEIGSYLTDWSPHPEDKTGSYDLLIENIENVLLQHSSTIESTRSIVDKVNQEITNSVTKTTFESTVYGIQNDFSERFENIEDGYDKWHLAIYDKSKFKDTKLDDEVDDRERADMGVFALDNSNVNPEEEILVLDNSVAMRVNSVNKILLYTGWAKFSESTTLNINCSHHKGSIYLNGLKIFTSDNLTTDQVVFDFNEGWNLIQMVGNESNFSFNLKISQHKNCEIFNCLMGVPTSMETKIREQGAYLNIYLDKIMSEVFDIETTTGVDGITHSRITGSKIVQSSDAIDFLVHRSYDEESHESSFSITPEGIQAITDDFVIKDERGDAVIVSGGNIHAQSITTAMLNTNAIKSLNYLDYGAEVPEGETVPEFDVDSNSDDVHYSVRGTFLDLANGIFQSPSLYVDGADAYFRGTVHATDGVFNGTVYATDGSFTGTVYASDGSFTGTVYASDGEFTGTVYATAGKFIGELESSSGILGPWHLTQDALYKGSSVLGTYGAGNIYLGNNGFSLSDRFIYNSADTSLIIGVDSLAIGPRSIQETILENGTRVYYVNNIPTIQNAPAADWINNQEADIHVNDLCIDKSTGKTYQFVKTSGKRFKIIFIENFISVKKIFRL